MSNTRNDVSSTSDSSAVSNKGALGNTATSGFLMTSKAEIKTQAKIPKLWSPTIQEAANARQFQAANVKPTFPESTFDSMNTALVAPSDYEHLFTNDQSNNRAVFREGDHVAKTTSLQELAKHFMHKEPTSTTEAYKTAKTNARRLPTPPLKLKAKDNLSPIGLKTSIFNDIYNVAQKTFSSSSSMVPGNSAKFSSNRESWTKNTPSFKQVLPKQVLKTLKAQTPNLNVQVKQRVKSPVSRLMFNLNYKSSPKRPSAYAKIHVPSQNSTSKVKENTTQNYFGTTGDQTAQTFTSKPSTLHPKPGTTTKRGHRGLSKRKSKSKSKKKNTTKQTTQTSFGATGDQSTKTFTKSGNSGFSKQISKSMSKKKSALRCRVGCCCC